MTVSAWSIPGSAGQPILGNTHGPEDGAGGATVLIAHGFKGYKDYGMFPRLAERLAAAGHVAHRFNFSHSGMTNDTATFARPDLFARDTWNRQVDDLAALHEALAAGVLPGGERPVVWLGHSRGGVSVLLAAGRGRLIGAAAYITLAAPDRTCSLSDEEQAALRAGPVASPSSRTGQTLMVEPSWLFEQEADPPAHDLLALVANIDVPCLLIHGTADPTVPASSVSTLASAIGRHATAHLIAGANHVFDVPNPLPDDADAGEAFAAMWALVEGFLERVR